MTGWGGLSGIDKTLISITWSQASVKIGKLRGVQKLHLSKRPKERLCLQRRYHPTGNIGGVVDACKSGLIDLVNMPADGTDKGIWDNMSILVIHKA